MKTGTLYVTATPIGNLSDMTPRAVRVLSEADMAAAEDTRRSRALFSHFQIKTPLYSCHAHNEEKRGDFFIRALSEGKNVALISDAGTPCICDPGHRLVQMAVEAGIEVVSVCGASAVTAALSVSGFDASCFAFIGFWPRNKKERDETWEKIKTFNGLCVFYESPLRISKTLTFFHDNEPALQICLCNDLTKKFERVYRGTPGEVAAGLAENPDAQKGEYTCIAAFPRPEKNEPKKEPPGLPPEETLTLEARLIDLMIKKSCGMKTAAALLRASSPKETKKEIYAAMLRVKELFK